LPKDKSDTDYARYVEKVRRALSNDGFEIRTGDTVHGYRLDLLAFGTTFNPSFITLMGKNWACSVSYAEKVNSDYVRQYAEAVYEYCQNGATADNTRLPLSANIVLPAIASHGFSEDTIDYVQKHELTSYLSRKAGRFNHPVLVDLDTGKLSYHERDSFGSYGYAAPMDSAVKKYLSPNSGNSEV
jgi:hypothetical protein